MRTASCELSVPRAIAASLVALFAMIATVMFGGCARSPTAAPDPNANMFRDFTDGKFDAAGHPLNAAVVAASALCPSAGAASGDTIVLARGCDGVLPNTALFGDLEVNARFRVDAHGADPIATFVVVSSDGHLLATDTLTATRLRDTGSWIDFGLGWTGDATTARISIMPGAGASIELAYVETFPRRFGLAIAPGSGPIADTDVLEFEFAKDRSVNTISLDGSDMSATLAQLLASGTATRADTDFRSAIVLPVGALASMRGDIAELRVATDAAAARVQLRRSPPPCAFEGDASAATKVLVTGFQPFPADSSHENVSGVAVSALDPSSLRGARVMRLVLPVEYDRAAAEVADAIARCGPDVVISFGQGGDAIALEEVAYNLQDTGEVAGGVPDNRGIVRAATPIDAAAPATRDTLLPLDTIDKAMQAIGEAPQHSRDPGRYVCNNVMFADLGAIATGSGARAGFIHLPYTETFDDATRTRFAKVVAAAIQATVDAR